MKCLIKVGRIVLQGIYQMLKLFPVQDKIVLISRQSNEPSVDFMLLNREIKKQRAFVKVIILCKTLDGGINSSLFKKMGYIFHMLRQMYHLATSKVVVLDTYCIVVSLLKHRKRLQVIQMWHSMGTMKLFGYTALGNNEGSSFELAKSMHMHENYSYFIAASPNYVDHLARGFNCSADKAFICPLPRYDLLKNKRYRLSKRKQIYAKYPGLEGKKIILYCPTFRKEDSQMEKAVKGLIDNITDEYVLVIKLHPLSKIQISGDCVYIAKDFSTFDMLFVADFVVSDYSCIVYEAGILELPLYFYAFDFDKYANNRGLAINYVKEIPGVIYREPQLIMKAIQRKESNLDDVKGFTDQYIEPVENATKKIVEFIFRVGGIDCAR